MTKSQAIEAIGWFGGVRGIRIDTSIHTDIKNFRKIVGFFEVSNPSYRYNLLKDLYVSIEIGDLHVFGHTGITKEVFQEKFLETDHEVEEFDVDFITGVVYYTVGDVLEDGTGITIEGYADFWEVVEKCQN